MKKTIPAPASAKSVKVSAKAKPAPMKVVVPAPKKPTPAAAKPVKAPAKPVPAKVSVKAVAPAPKAPPPQPSVKKPQVMGKADMRKFQEKLLEVRSQLTAQVRSITDASLSSNKQAGEELADIGSDNFYREIGLSMMSEDGKKLIQIQEALEKVQHGAYGACEECGQLIGPGRLKAIPYAKYCIDCQAELEKLHLDDFDQAPEEPETGGFTISEGGDDEEGGSSLPDPEPEPEEEEDEPAGADEEDED